METARNPSSEAPEPQLTRRQEITQLAALIRKDRDRNPAVMALLRLLALQFEAAKDSLLTATPASFPPLQGEAIAIGSLLRLLTIDPPAIPTEET